MLMDTTIKVSKDGSQWYAVREGFRNLQEDCSGFADTPDEAVKNLITEEIEKGVTNAPDLLYQKEDSIRDAAAARIFANALGGLLRVKGDNPNEENEGVIVLVDGHKYVVFVAANNAVNITNVDSQDKAIVGTKVWLHFGDQDTEVPEDAIVLTKQPTDVKMEGKVSDPEVPVSEDSKVEFSVIPETNM
jgi:hypothetical protein